MQERGGKREKRNTNTYSAMSLEIKVNEQIKEAMLAKEKVRLESLRAIKAAILLAKTAEGGSKGLTDNDVLKIIQKLVKQRKESAEIYSSQNRKDLADLEIEEAKYLEEFLPAQLTPQELEGLVKEIISRLGVKNIAEMGKVMGVATKELSGKADGRAVSETVKRLLS